LRKNLQNKKEYNIDIGTQTSREKKGTERADRSGIGEGASYLVAHYMGKKFLQEEEESPWAALLRIHCRSVRRKGGKTDLKKDAGLRGKGGGTEGHMFLWEIVSLICRIRPIKEKPMV